VRCLKFILIVGGIVCLFSSLYRLVVDLSACLVVHSDYRWNYVCVQ